MLNNLRIKNFRMLEDLDIPKLGRVNLIVGKNNSGKSSVLEALRIYAGNANPLLLREILLGHDEYFKIDLDAKDEKQYFYWHGLKNLFPNRAFPTDENTAISIFSNDEVLLKLEYGFSYFKDHVVNAIDEAAPMVIPRRVFVSQTEGVNLEKSIELDAAIRITFASGNVVLIDLASHKINFFQKLFTESLNHSFVSTGILSAEALAKLWDKTALSPNEDIVLQALKIIDANIERLAFIEGYSTEPKRLAIVKLKNSDTPVPLNSMGDGMSRILQLILSVFPAKNGILLIDEFENGLHFSVQEQVWRMIFKLATELNMQVFATTHSWDCIESFAKAAIDSPEAGVLLKLSKSRLTSDHGKIIATVYDEEALKIVTATELEVR